MSQSLSVAEAEFAPIAPANTTPRRGSQNRTQAVRSRGKRLPEPIAVPDLDWPADLYADGASIDELAAEVFPLPSHVEAMLFCPEAETCTRH